MDYLDDFLFAAPPEEAKQLAEFVRWLLVRLGWHLSEKTALEPASTCEFLGTTIDTDRFVFVATPAKVEAALALVRRVREEVRNGGRTSRLGLKVLAGKIGAMRLALPSARAWTREMLACSGDGVGETEPTHELLVELEHWEATLQRPEKTWRPIRSAAAEVEMHVDVSTAGWGAHLGTEERSGWIPPRWVGRSSTAREMAALQCAAEAFLPQLTDRRVRVVMDSFAAVRNLTKEGGPVRDLCALVKRWTTWCEANKVRPVYEWVKREENKQADMLSRVHGTAWRVRDTVLAEAQRRWGEGPTLCAPDWAVLADAVKRCERDRRAVYILTPDWPGQGWWMTLTGHERAHFTISFEEAYWPSGAPVRSPGWRMRVTWADFCGADVLRPLGPTGAGMRLDRGRAGTRIPRSRGAGGRPRYENKRGHWHRQRRHQQDDLRLRPSRARRASQNGRTGSRCGSAWRLARQQQRQPEQRRGWCLCRLSRWRK
jgi:hypothetical protein